MDTANNPTTITGSLVRPTSQPNLDHSENERKLMILLKLGSHFWVPSFTPAQAKALLADYIEDLSKYTSVEVNSFAATWRKDPAKTKFPRVGDIVFGIERARVDARDIAKRPAGLQTETGDSRPMCWWLLDPYVWEPHWTETDIPERDRAAFYGKMDRIIAAGTVGKGVNEFYGLARKYPK